MEIEKQVEAAAKARAGWTTEIMGRIPDVKPLYLECSHCGFLFVTDSDIPHEALLNCPRGCGRMRRVSGKRFRERNRG